jgi:predicted MFS family arabinose efflux permease
MGSRAVLFFPVSARIFAFHLPDCRSFFIRLAMSIASPSTGAARWAVSYIFAGNGVVYASWISRLPRIQEMYAVDYGQLSLFMLSLSLGALVGMPITGTIIVKTGSRLITMVLAVAMCMAYPLIPLMPAFPALLGLGFLLGMSNGSLDVAMNAQGILAEDQLGKPVMSSFHAAFSIGMMAGAALGSLAVELGLTVFQHLVFISAPLLLGQLWAFRSLVRDRPAPVAAADDPPPKRRYRLIPELMLLGVICFCGMLGEGAMADWLTNYMEKDIGTSRAVAPLALAFFAGAMTLGRLIGDRARTYFGDTHLLRLESLLAIGGMVLVVVSTHPIPVVLGCFLVGSGLATIVPIVYSVSGRFPGLASGVGISVVSTIGYTGFLVGPPAIGFIGDWVGLRFGLLVVLFLFVIMAGLVWLVLKVPGRGRSN